MSNPFIQSQATAFEQLQATQAAGAAPVNATARRRSFDQFLQTGLPTTRLERWKYTSLRALEQRRFVGEATNVAADNGLPLEDLPGCDGPRLVWVNGQFSETLSRVAQLPEGVSLSHAANLPAAGNERLTDGVFTLNAAFAPDTLVLRIRAGARLATPIQLVNVSVARAVDVAAHSRLWIQLDDGAAATIVQHCFGSAPHANLCTQTLVLDVGREAHLQIVRLQDESAGATLLCKTSATVSGTLEATELCLGAALSRHEFAVDLTDRSWPPPIESGTGQVSLDTNASLQVGSGAKPKFSSRGVFALRARQHADFQLSIAHRVGNGSSDVFWRGVAAGRARGVFHGAITIERGADGSAAKLSNKNLLLSEHAEIDTQPVLEIFADEVKASHGATVGQLDERALFYLRSRGLPLEAARALLTYAFCRETLDGVEPLALREHLAQRLVDHLPQDNATEADSLQPFIATATTPSVPSVTR